jgi:hypothetical protein
MCDPLLTPFEAIVYLRLDQGKLRQPREALRWLCRRNRLRFAKVGRSILFRKSWLDDLIDRSAVQQNSHNCNTPAPKARRK